MRNFFCPQFWGRKWLRQFDGRLEQLRCFCRKTLHTHKIPRFGGGGGNLVFVGGGNGREDFSECWHSPRGKMMGEPEISTSDKPKNAANTWKLLQVVLLLM